MIHSEDRQQEDRRGCSHLVLISDILVPVRLSENLVKSDDTVCSYDVRLQKAAMFLSHVALIPTERPAGVCELPPGNRTAS